MARNPKLTNDLIERFCDCIRSGLSNRDACMACKVSEDSFYKWIREAEYPIEGDKYYSLKRKLTESIKEAEVQFKNIHIQNITNLSKQDWKASAWMLERKFPKEYSKFERSAILMGEEKKSVEDLMPLADMLKDEDDNEDGDN